MRNTLFTIVLGACAMLSGEVVAINDNTALISVSIGHRTPIDAFSALLAMGGLDCSDPTFRHAGKLRFAKPIGPFEFAETAEFPVRHPFLDMHCFRSGQLCSVFSVAETNSLPFDKAFSDVRQLKDLFASELNGTEFEEMSCGEGELIVKSVRPGLEGWNIEIKVNAVVRGKTVYTLRLVREFDRKPKSAELPIVDVDI